MTIIRITAEQVLNAQKAKEKSIMEDIDFQAFEEHRLRSKEIITKQSKKEAK